MGNKLKIRPRGTELQLCSVKIQLFCTKALISLAKCSVILFLQLLRSGLEGLADKRVIGDHYCLYYHPSPSGTQINWSNRRASVVGLSPPPSIRNKLHYTSLCAQIKHAKPCCPTLNQGNCRRMRLFQSLRLRKCKLKSAEPGDCGHFQLCVCCPSFRNSCQSHSHHGETGVGPLQAVHAGDREGRPGGGH